MKTPLHFLDLRQQRRYFLRPVGVLVGRASGIGKLKVPLFALLAAVIIFDTVGCGKQTPQGYHLYALFTRPQNLKPGDPVIMAGAQIGYIDSIELDPAKAETHVTMHIQRSVVVKIDSTATINPTSSPGQSSIVLDGGSSSFHDATHNSILMTREKPSSGN